jgi:phosphatidylglycerophosphate synthase
VIAHALTATRLLLAAPVAMGLARPDVTSPVSLLALIGVAIATDYWDGRVARLTNSLSARGQLFDHATDFLFVTAGLIGAAVGGLVTPVLPAVIVVAFGQYVLDSYLLHRQKELRMSVIGRWNGVLYFVPLVVISVSRLDLLSGVELPLTRATGVLGWLLVVSTVVSIVDRTLAPRRMGLG